MSVRELRNNGGAVLDRVARGVTLVVTRDGERAARRAHLQQVEADFEALDFDAAAARAFGRVASSLRRHRRKPAARADDALIAAVAVPQDLPLCTSNPENFDGIDDLTVCVVPHPGP